MTTASSYRDSHASAGYGARYRKTYERGYYAAQWSEIEAPILRQVLEPLGGPDRSCLDFACGTGRISRLASEYFGRVVGVDISEAMLREAEAPANVELVRQDITRTPLEETFDVALAFRFFLKAEADLQVEALRAIRRHLKPGGHLVSNIHMAATSPMGTVYRFLRRLTGAEIHATTTVEAYAELLAAQGFAVESIVHYSFLPRPGHFFGALAERLIAPAERWAKRLGLPPKLAQSFLVTAKRTD